MKVGAGGLGKGIERASWYVPGNTHWRCGGVVQGDFLTLSEGQWRDRLICVRGCGLVALCCRLPPHLAGLGWAVCLGLGAV